ncbi:MAG: hypothetical protein WCD18_18325 [Thermosynechococcaceae cyanobacterium]
MNIILSNKASKELKIDLNLDSQFIPDINTWRIDCLSLSKKRVFLSTNEKTLYTCVSSYRGGLKEIIKKISLAIKQENIRLDEIYYVKFQNRSITSSMNNIKTIIDQMDKYNPMSNEEYERLINNIPFKYLSFRKPYELHKSAFT